MAMVDAMPVPDSHQKVDELFLFWLSEPSTQEMLRNELTKVCRYGSDGGSGGGDSPSIMDSLVQPSPVPRSSSPSSNNSNYRTPSPPLHLSNSPKSPRAKRRAKSPRRNLKYGPSGSSAGTGKAAVNGPTFIEDTDYFPTPSSSTEPDARKAEKAGAPGRTEPSTTPKDTEQQKAQSEKSAKPTRGSSEVIPRFFFPNGRAGEANEKNADVQLKAAANALQNGEVTMAEFHPVVKAMELPLYWKAPLFRACQEVDSAQLDTAATVSLPGLRKTWQSVTRHCHDDPARFVKLMATEGRSYLTESDFDYLIQDIVDTHPGLAFLATAPEFHARYIETVISRIFYSVDRSWNNRITVSDLRRSNFLQILKSLEEEQDINAVTDYFSYEHFYVIYCKFWELDTDHDLVIDEQDLSRHADHALTPLVIQRIMSGIVSRDKTAPAGKLSYRDFIWFLLSEEDKTSQRSIEYWFRCLDVDGDGVLSLYELQLFYEEVLQRLRELSIECLSVENTVCQVLDMVNPRLKNCISLSDLKVCKLTPAFLNTFINVEKYLEFEQRDPVTMAREEAETPCSEWDRYAAEQYEILLAEEAGENETSNADDETGDSDLGEEEKEILALL